MRQLAYRLWGRLPRRLRRLLVHLGTPSYTVGAIGVVEDAGDVLLVRLAYRGSWGLPGGLVERGEQPAAAVVREVAEEVGLAVALHDPPTVVVEPQVRRVDVVFRCSAAPGVDPRSAAPRSAEILEARWWPLDALPTLQREAADALRVSRWVR